MTCGNGGDTDTGAGSDDGDGAEEDQEGPGAQADQGLDPLGSSQLPPSPPSLPPGKLSWRIS